MWNDLVDYLVNKGLNRSEVVSGSIPQNSLDYILSFIKSDTPIKGLHVGNFVGISLTYLTNSITQLHSKSIMVSIDPNIEHRGIVNPQAYVLELLSKYNLLGNSIMLTGYSLEQNFVNDGRNYITNQKLDNPDPKTFACADQLSLLATISLNTFDFVLIDGNHDAQYLSKELTEIHKLLKPCGLVFLDDIDDAWYELRDVYLNLPEELYMKVDRNGRIGVLRKK